MRRFSFAAIAVALMIAPAIQASTIDFTTGPLSGSGYGNYIEKSDGTVTARLTGWSATTANFTASQVKLWPTGIGTCSSSEGLNCPGGPHTVDNDGRDEVLLITFSTPVLVTQAVITAWAQDYDASFWGGSGSISMGATSFAMLDAFGRNTHEFVGTASAGNSWRPVSLLSLESPVSWLVFGVEPGETNDKFKFKTVSFTVPEEDTPEPGTLLLVGIGTALLAARSRKRRP